MNLYNPVQVKKRDFLTSQNAKSPWYRLNRLVFKQLLLSCDEDSDDAVMSGPEWDDSLMTIRHWDVLVAFQLLHLHSGSSTLPTTVILHNPHNLSASLPLANCIFHKKKKQISIFFNMSTLPSVPLSCLLLALEKARENCKYSILARPKPGYGRQGQAGEILGPGHFSCGYIMRCSQRPAFRGSAHFS